MNPVIGLDVSKGESQVQAFLDKDKSYVRCLFFILMTPLYQHAVCTSYTETSSAQLLLSLQLSARLTA